MPFDFLLSRSAIFDICNTPKYCIITILYTNWCFEPNPESLTSFSTVKHCCRHVRRTASTEWI